MTNPSAGPSLVTPAASPSGPVGALLPAALLASSFAAAPPAAAQGIPEGEGVFTTGDPVGYDEHFGEPLVASLESLSTYLADLDFRVVRTEGRIVRISDPRYLKLVDGLAAVLLVPVEEIDPRDLLPFAGKRVEVVGLARELPEKQDPDYCGYPETKCREPRLPALPDRLGRASWPLNSVTFWRVVDATPLSSGRRRDGGGLHIADVLADPERFEGREVTLTGRFRGANLFGDLPPESRRGDEDWVIERDGAALWVTDEKPQGRGWRLDPGSKSESRWWIRVTGKIEVRNGVVVLDADELELRPRPD